MGSSLNNGPKPSNTADAPPLSSGNLQMNSVENPLKASYKSLAGAVKCHVAFTVVMDVNHS